MSDREGRSGPSDDDLSLPRATVAKMIQGEGYIRPIFHFPPLLSIFRRVSPLCCGWRAIRDRLGLTLLSSSEPCHGGLELLPEDVTCAKDTRNLVIECCVGKTILLNIHPVSILTPFLTVEFIHLLSSEANEICEKESKKTIAPEHIISALQVLPSLEIACSSPD